MKKLSMDELQRVSVEEFKEIKKTPIVMILDNIRSMNNVGSVFRSCDGFAVEKLILCGITATPPHKDIAKTALGATESVAWEYEKETLTAIQKLKEEGYIVVAIEQADQAEWLHEYPIEKDKKYAIILGNEVFGVEEQLLPYCDAVIEIPQHGTKHSLNVTIAGGIALWHFYLALQ